jgi:lysophospholipase L1-like esterase
MTWNKPPQSSGGANTTVQVGSTNGHLLVNGQDVIVYDDTSIKSTITTGTSLLSGKKYACFGDSITSDQVSGLGTYINTVLGTTSVGNYAVGYAICSDWQGGFTSTINLTDTSDGQNNWNVLSNQVRRLLQYTAPLGAQITWTHTLDGVFSIDTTYGTGLGNTTSKPDILYIAMGTNDGENINFSQIFDDTDTVFSQTYSQLTRKSIASALRWAIETLQSAYPNANIFVASPLQTGKSGSSYPHMTYANTKLKRDIIEKVCQFSSVHFIDSFNDSGFSPVTMGKTGNELSGDQLHPNSNGKSWVGKYVANEIKRRYSQR